MHGDVMRPGTSRPCSSSASVVISINAVVDPHGRLLLVDKTGFNELKLTVPFDNRTGKALALRQCDYDTIILGTSRAESGIAVDQPPFDAARTYNAALKAATMYEMRRLVEYALQYRSLRRVVIGLDFVSFNERAISFDDFDDSPLASPPSAGSLVALPAVMAKPCENHGST